MEKQKKSFMTRLKIMKAYIDLMKDKDFDAITVKAIVDKSEITRGTFYLYFSDIYELVTDIENYLISDIPTVDTNEIKPINALEPITLETCRNHTWEREWFEYYEEYREPFNALLGPHGDSSFYNKIKKNLQDTLQIRMKQDSMPDDQQHDFFLNIIPDLYLLLAKEWTNKTSFESINIESIANIVSTIRVGSLYMHHLEALNDLKINNSSEEES